jgi:hypothetical protein
MDVFRLPRAQPSAGVSNFPDTGLPSKGGDGEGWGGGGGGGGAPPPPPNPPLFFPPFLGLRPRADRGLRSVPGV